jgi:hypothetical protein
MIEAQDILAGVEQVGIRPGMSRDYRRDDWEVGYRHVLRGGGDPQARVHDADRDKAYAYYQYLIDGESDYYSAYIERADGASWEGRDLPPAPDGWCYRDDQLTRWSWL